MSSPSPSADPTKVIVGYFLDVLAPLAIYYLFHLLGIPPILGTIAGGIAAVVSTIRNTVRQRRVDRIGLLVIIEILVSLIFLGIHGDPRILAIKPAILLEIAGVYLFFTSLKGKPMNYSGARAMASRKDPARGELFDRTWDESPTFRRTVRFIAFVWSLAFVLDGILRVVVLYSFPVERAMLLANAPHIVTISLLVGLSALAGKRMGELVDREAASEKGVSAPQPPTVVT